MNGPIGLHGGGEYLAGDEPFLDALLEAARRAAADRIVAGGPTADEDRSDFDVDGHAVAVSNEPVRVVILPTAAARGMPDQAAANGRRAFERRAATRRVRAVVDIARVVDAASADDPRVADLLAAADLIHLPGGDPDLIPAVLAGSRALAGVEAAWRRGAVVAGASAGAMALAEWTWTPDGGIRGLGFVHGLAVVPHYDEVRRTRWQHALDELAPGGIGYLGLDERTGVLSTSDAATDATWRVIGPGAAYWFTRGASEPRIGRDPDVIRLDP